MAREIPLTRGMVALVDDEDFARLGHLTWQARQSPTHNTAYAVRAVLVDGVGWRLLPLHRAIMEPPADLVIDHINSDGLDNRRENLRICTRAENSRNRVTEKIKIGQKGTVYLPSGRWRAAIVASGKSHHLGVFDTPEEAARAYDARARELHGEFARLNYPNEAP